MKSNRTTKAKPASAKLTREQELKNLKTSNLSAGIVMLIVGAISLVFCPPAIIIFIALAIWGFKRASDNDKELQQLEKEKAEQLQREAEEKEKQREAAEKTAQERKEAAERAAAERAAKIKECQEKVANDPAEYKRLQDLCKTIHTEYKDLMKEIRADLKDLDSCDMSDIIYKLNECWRKLGVIETNITYYGVYDLAIYEEEEKVEKLAKSAINKYVKYEKEAGAESWEIDMYQFTELDFLSDFVYDKIEKLDRY